MSTWGDYISTSMVAASDLSDEQFHGVKLNTTNGQVDVADADGDLFLGVLMNKPEIGCAAEVALMGVVKVYAGAAITPQGELLTTDASGHFIEASNGDVVHAIALETAGGSGDLIKAFLIGPRYEADESLYTTAS